MPANITIQKFESLKDDRKFNIFYITPPCVNVNTVKDVLYMDETSKKEMQKHFENLSASDLNKKGIGVIFGTFEGLHLGHRSMLKTAKALCSELYIGIEDQQKALERKRNKHPIQSNESRKSVLMAAYDIIISCCVEICKIREYKNNSIHLKNNSTHTNKVSRIIFLNSTFS